MNQSEYYRTNQDDRLDRVCYRWYGRVQKRVEAVLAANPRLAERGSLLEAGILIEMPPAAAIQELSPARLWE